MTLLAPAILLIEDDEGLLTLARRRLERHGLKVSGASSIVQARDLLQSMVFDVLVIDYQLDENMSGIDFYNELRAHGVIIPAVMCSGFSDEVHLDEALRSGFAHVLPKSQDYLDELPPLVLSLLPH
jgi:DNA-binding NtrC family response regulator